MQIRSWVQTSLATGVLCAVNIAASLTTWHICFDNQDVLLLQANSTWSNYKQNGIYQVHNLNVIVLINLIYYLASKTAKIAAWILGEENSWRTEKNHHR